MACHHGMGEGRPVSGTSELRFESREKFTEHGCVMKAAIQAAGTAGSKALGQS